MMALMQKLGRLASAKTRCVGIAKHVQCASYSSSALYGDRDPQPLFTDLETQKLLKSMTGFNLNKIFGKRPVLSNKNEVKFMTSEELEEEFRTCVAKAQKELVMPPQVKLLEDTEELIVYDPALKDFSKFNYVFADITYGLHDTQRNVFVRYTDGSLKYAPLDVAKRVRHVFVPVEHRKYPEPRMFRVPKYFKALLDAHNYEFVLKRMLWQYDPQEEAFHRVSAAVYDHINAGKQFDLLRSTRHFGPMAFYYACNRCIENLLCDMLQRDHVPNGAELVALLYKVNGISKPYQETIATLEELLPTPAERVLQQLIGSITKKADTQQDIYNAIGKNENDFKADEVSFNLIEEYIESDHSQNKVELREALQIAENASEEKRQLFDGLRKAHGLQEDPVKHQQQQQQCTA